ncbi:MAG: hypothetical protein CSB34_07040 [Desulfobulbus propionicus]|nr:MAG: hypothetical protein CSB34_07040 [Desulfobulbus propionicus]
MNLGQLHHIFRSKEWHRQWGLVRLVKTWDRLLGDPLAKVTYPAFFRGNVLWLFVENSAWMQQVQFLKLDILAAVQKTLPEESIEDIRFMLDPGNDQIQEKAEQTAPLPVNKEAEQHLKDMIAGVKDEKTRQALHKMWLAFNTNGATLKPE